MSRRLDKTEHSVGKQVKVAIDLENIQLVNVPEVGLAIDRTCPVGRKERVANFIALHNVNRIREIAHPTSVIEMEVGVDDVPHVLRLDAELV